MKRINNMLNGFLQSLSLRVKKVILMCCCLFVGAYAIGLIIGAISYEMPRQQDIIRPFMPRQMEKITADQARENIAKFRAYMDSLGTTAQGRRQRDSIIISHPGLMDTIARLEKLINH